MWFHVDTIIRYSAGLFIRVRSIRTSLRDGGTTARPHHVHHPASWFPLGSRLSLLSRRAALLCQTSQKTKLVESPGRCSREARLWTTVVVELPSWHSKGGGFSSAALGGSAALPSTPEPDKGRRPKNRHSSKAKSASARVFCLLPVLAFFCRGFPGSRSLVLWPCPFGFLFVLVPPRVSFYWPRASRSSSQREGRRVKFRGTDPRTGLFRYLPSLSTF